MIRKLTNNEISNILKIINNAAITYKGIIPNKCWHEPYMSEQELINEFNDGVQMFGYYRNDKLVSVMGIQELEDVTLIRHAYTLTSFQRMSIGKSLLKYLFKINRNTFLLVGTWRDATWAIRFYEKFGFILQTKKQAVYLLKKYWKIPLTQIQNSVVLKK